MKYQYIRNDGFSFTTKSFNDYCNELTHLKRSIEIYKTELITIDHNKHGMILYFRTIEKSGQKSNGS